ncbi:hypothetical protein QR680_000112 [Steinernema hermaphroditum]|uniref:Uncharacterized protein n=1 Tax=Steinernema hermaphroditum TaxID=289476 RepID=A0AA39GU65_9BILA|nr:hypothetical protein QR680_000112 [Steinernema hermaphroditum]
MCFDCQSVAVAASIHYTIRQWRSPIDERVRRRLLSAVDSANVSRRVGGARFVYRITCDQNQAILQRV